MPPNDDPLFLKSKGAGRLQPRSLAVLEALLHFRKNVAEKKDQPLFKVFSNDSMIKMAMEKPLTLRRLKSTKALSKKQINIYGDALLESIQTAVQISEKDLPVYPRKKAPALSGKVPGRVKALKKWRDKTAGQLKMDPSLICNKTLLTDIAVRNPSDTNELETVKNIKNWQKTAFGEEILAVLKR
jgi:ribonuclease D